jgi:hypothetical protein
VYCDSTCRRRAERRLRAARLGVGQPLEVEAVDPLALVPVDLAELEVVELAELEPAEVEPVALDVEAFNRAMGRMR